MALEAAFGELHSQLQILHEALDSLHTTIIEDKPLQDDVVLVELFGDVVDDLLGWLAGALDADGEAQQAVAHPLDLNRTCRALIKCQERLNHIHHRFVVGVASYERVKELTHFGRRRGGEWQAWVHGVKAAIDDCHSLLFAVGQALCVCWQEVGERVGINSILVQSSPIGQSALTPSGR